MPLIQRRVFRRRQVFLADLRKDDLERLDCADEDRRVGQIKADPQLPDRFSRAQRLRAARLGERDVHPAGEPVLQIPLGLSVTDENKFGHGRNYIIT